MINTKNAISDDMVTMSQTSEVELDTVQTKTSEVSQKALKASAPSTESLKRKWEDLGANTKISKQNRQIQKTYDVVRFIWGKARESPGVDVSGLAQVIRGLPRRKNESSLEYIQNLRKFLRSTGIFHFDDDLTALEKLASSGDGLKFR